MRMRNTQRFHEMRGLLGWFGRLEVAAAPWWEGERYSNPLFTDCQSCKQRSKDIALLVVHN